jgi:hypothetical protein
VRALSWSEDLVLPRLSALEVRMFRWMITAFVDCCSFTPDPIALDGARLVYSLRRMLAAMLLRAWRDVSHVTLVAEDLDGSQVYRVTPTSVRHQGAVWCIRQEREIVIVLIVASIASGVRYEELPDLFRGGRDIGADAMEPRASVESVEAARREVS